MQNSVFDNIPPIFNTYAGRFWDDSLYSDLTFVNKAEILKRIAFEIYDFSTTLDNVPKNKVLNFNNHISEDCKNYPIQDELDAYAEEICGYLTVVDVSAFGLTTKETAIYDFVKETLEIVIREHYS
jgi:hypothetical protein